MKENERRIAELNAIMKAVAPKEEKKEAKPKAEKKQTKKAGK